MKLFAFVAAALGVSTAYAAKPPVLTDVPDYCKAQVAVMLQAASGGYNLNANGSVTADIDARDYNALIIKKGVELRSGPASGGAEGSIWQEIRADFESTSAYGTTSKGTVTVSASRGNCFVEQFTAK